MNASETPDFREMLKEALNERLSANTQYSLRAFARDLGLSAAQMSHVLSGRKGLSPEGAEKIAKRLGWNESEQDYFCTLVSAQHARSEAMKKAARAKIQNMRLNEKSDSEHRIELQMDAFRVISEWYHFPILETLKLNSKANAKQLAKKMGIREIEAQMALSRLERLELIKGKPGAYEIQQDTVLPKEHISSDAVKKFHAQVMEKAKIALQRQALDERYFRTIFFPFSPNEIPSAQKDIQDFFETFAQKYSKSASSENEVYTLATQFFRITEKGPL